MCTFLKPLVNFTHKAHIRYAGSYSLKKAFTEESFREVINDDDIKDPAAVKKVLFCSGKIYFDLLEYKQKNNQHEVALVRLEQIHPLPVKQLDELHKQYAKATWFWVQEEPLNMGAASFLQMYLKSFNYGVISRQPSASTATGFNKVHHQEQAELVETAFQI